MGPLNLKPTKNQLKEFGPLNEEELTAIMTIQGKHFSLTILALLYAGGHFMLDTGACSLQVNCIQLQYQPDTSKRSVGYWSLLLTKAEQPYNYSEKECLAIIWSVLLLRCTSNIISSPFGLTTNRTDGSWI